jgi:hypothetical protein
MKKMNLMLLIMALMVINGCAESSALIKASSTSMHTDVFQELSNGGLVPPGLADLRIASSLKTHKPGIYSGKDVHGTPEYRLLINIDGQAVQLQGSLHEENIEPRWLRDPEAGKGIRYGFGRDLRLKAGTHRVVIAIPSDDVAVERKITLADGSDNSLKVEPIYRGTANSRRPGFYGQTSFSEGITGLRVTFNGEPL